MLKFSKTNKSVLLDEILMGGGGGGGGVLGARIRHWAYAWLLSLSLSPCTCTAWLCILLCVPDLQTVAGFGSQAPL